MIPFFSRNIPIVSAYQPATGMASLSLLLQNNPNSRVVETTWETFQNVIHQVVQSDAWEVLMATINSIFGLFCGYLISKWKRRLDAKQNQRFRNDIPEDEREMVAINN